jgi:lipopolysaccharide/colanic/teichoic acid biosynthesis glycosyltransferase
MDYTPDRPLTWPKPRPGNGASPFVPQPPASPVYREAGVDAGRPEEPRHWPQVPETKRVLDVIGALGLLFLNTPLLATIAVIIKLDSPGPVIYAQERVGLNRRRGQRRAERIPVNRELRRDDRRQEAGEGRPFLIYKFRTMRLDAEQWGPQWAKPEDPRATRVGRLLRASRLDELPQLWNVIRGDMSLVGPRPERPCFVRRFAQHIPNYRHRLLAQPGITGLAQVEHHYDSCEDDVRRKLDYDLDYLRNYSFFKDLRILMKTVLVMVTGRGAQ